MQMVHVTPNAGLIKSPNQTPSEREKEVRRRQRNNCQKSKYIVLILTFLQSKTTHTHTHTDSEHNWLEKCWLAIITASARLCFLTVPASFSLSRRGFPPFLKHTHILPSLHPHFWPTAFEHIVRHDGCYCICVRR